jgi:putative ABC transport system permease protein
LEALLQDLRYAVRTLLRSPGFAAAVVLTLALAIGANSTLFSVLCAALLQPLPVKDPQGVVAVFTSDYSGPSYSASSYPDYLSFRDSGAFVGLVAYTLQPVGLSETDAPSARLWAEAVTGNYFETLGIPVFRGRPLAPDDERPGAALAVVVSHQLWQTRFGGDPLLLGRSLMLSGHTATVVGIGGEGRTGLLRGLAVDLWIPLTARGLLKGDDHDLEERGDRGLFVLGRLAPGVTLASAQQRLDALAHALQAEFPNHWTDLHQQARRISVLPEPAVRVSPDARRPVALVLALLLVMAGLLLVIATSNVASLVLARTATRRRETAIRLALGASARQIGRRFLVETLLLALAGGAGGVLVAYAVADALVGFRLPIPLPVHLDIHPDGRVLLFSLVVSVLTGVGLGLVPVLQAARPDLCRGLRGLSSGSGRASQSRSAFVVIQVALSVVLLVGGGLFLRSLGNAARIDPGFDPRNVVLLSAELSLAGYDAARTARFQEDLVERVGRQAGVMAVGLTTGLPLDPTALSRRGVAISGYTQEDGEDLEIPFAVIGPGFLEALRVPIVQGRPFNPEDASGAPRVALINETFARRYWPGQAPLGRTLEVGGAEAVTVVGVVGDGRYASLSEAQKPFFYLPILQDYDYVRRAGSFVPTTLAVRVSGDPASALARLRESVQSIDPRLAVYGARTLEQHLGMALLPARIGGLALGCFGIVGLLLASLGLSGMMSALVSERVREIGIRLALGARPGGVLALIVGSGMRLVGLGLALGLILSVPLARLAAGLLYGLSPSDPTTLLGAALLLALVAGLAAWIPARAAARVDPVRALKCE